MRALDKYIAYVVVAFITMICTALPAQLFAAQMSDYCITPPYINISPRPNLLMMFDNSASMNDLNYVDKGSATRTPTYCYDQTYSSATPYAGYFDNDTYYTFSSWAFSPSASFPADSDCAAPQTIIKRDNVLFVCFNNTTRTATKFAAKGHFLNWLSMSKFDVEKQILTGGKYDPDPSVQAFSAESRGCVGRKFIKQPLTADYAEGGTNTPLGVTFGISGPPDPNNPSAPSPGGQTFIDIFMGAYNAAVCQTAINDFANSSIQKQTLINDIGACIGYSSTNRNTCQYAAGITCGNDADCGYSFTAGTCGAFTPNGTCGPLGGGSCSASTAGACSINNGTCPASGLANGVCVGGSKAGDACANDTPCKGNGTCTRYCVGGGKAGTACGTNAASDSTKCAFSRCTAGDTSKFSCTGNSDCDLKKCANPGPKLGQTCTTNSGCDSGTCTDGNVGAGCLLNSDCNMATATCTAGMVGACSKNSDCDLTVDPLGHGPCVQPASVQIKSTYGQTMHTCYQLLFKNQSLTSGDLNTVSGNNGCNSIYSAYHTCSGGTKDGSVCTGAADCPSGTCINGPLAIRPGSPVLVCGTDYAGYCASSADNWVHTTWNSMEYTSADDCVSAAITAYCGAAQVPNVTDPTEAPSATPQYANLPAILSDTGVEGQLGDPIPPKMPVQVLQTGAPTGLIQEFGSKIRLGAMIFNPYGTTSECSSTYPPLVNSVLCPKICSTDPRIICGSKMDCPFPATAECTTIAGFTGTRTCYYTGSLEQVLPVTTCTTDTDCGLAKSCLPGNNDAAKVISYIGYGHCALDTTTACATDAHCTAAGDSCVSDGVGSHSSGLIAAIDSIKGSAWTPFAEGFFDAIGYFAKMTDGRSNTDLRVNEADFDENLNPSQKPCQKNNVLLITDGMSTADLNTDVTTFAALYTSGTMSGPQTGAGTCTVPYQGSVNLDNLAWAAKNRKISALTKSSVTTTVPAKASEYITTYVVLSGATNSLPGECDSQTLLSNTAANGGTSLYTAQNPSQLKDKIKAALETIAAQAAAGTAASVLASGQGSGANLIQAVFYPLRKFDNNAEVSWTGRLTNFWYYVDPNLNNSSIHEDAGVYSAVTQTFGTGDKKLTLRTSLTGTQNDNVVQFYFDTTNDVTKAHRWQDTNGDSIVDGQLSDVLFESVGNLWEAGQLLWARNSSSRTIITSISSGSTITFDTPQKTALRPYLQASSDAESEALIRYVEGEDTPFSPAIAGFSNSYRPRKVSINGVGPNTWKLGDVLNSTPKIATWMPLNNYHIYYCDETYGPPRDPSLRDPVNNSAYLTSDQYRRRNVIFTGANDGMLHAFKLGTLQLSWPGMNTNYDKAKLTNTVCSLNGSINCISDAQCNAAGAGTCTGTATLGLGDEVWAFIPRNALPFLKYTADPNYCHVYSVDLTPFIFDASIGAPGSGDVSSTVRDVTHWRTILIGGMRYGGGCRKQGTCTGDSCVETPLLDPADNSKGLGYSSYFALDVTDPNNPPTLLWEFSSDQLGFSTSGPAIVRESIKIGSVTHNEKNGKWFVVLGSGPTGPIDPVTNQFMGHSDQNLRLFILDLKTGNLLRTIDTGVPLAFAGSLMNATVDTDLDYQDDLVYVPYVKDSDGTWTNGGVLRLATHQDTDPANWSTSYLIDNIGPVTTAVVKLVNGTSRGTCGAPSAVNSLWAYIGTGRYFFKLTESVDDAAGQRYIMGLKDPCVSSAAFDPTCSTDRTLGQLTNVTDIANAPTGDATNGWYITLDADQHNGTTTIDSSVRAERDITDPVTTTGGLVFFTTFKPYSDSCAMGGKSFIWALKYNNGGDASALLKGQALIQVSTGSIEQLKLSDAFKDSLTGQSTGNRKSAGMEGVPPTMQGLSVITTPAPVKKVLHLKER